MLKWKHTSEKFVHVTNMASWHMLSNAGRLRFCPFCDVTRLDIPMALAAVWRYSDDGDGNKFLKVIEVRKLHWSKSGDRNQFLIVICHQLGWNLSEAITSALAKNNDNPSNYKQFVQIIS